MRTFGLMRLGWPVLLMLLATSAFAEDRAPLVQSLELAVFQAPALANIGGTEHLVYELHISNLRAVDVVLTKVAVLDAGSREKPIGVFQDAALREAVGHAEIGAGKRAVLYAWMPLVSGAKPAAITHVINFDVLRESQREHLSMQGQRVPVRREKTLVLGAPLQGGRWVAVYGPNLDRGHRRFVYTIDGRSRIPARFAIDWMKIGDDNAFARAQASKVVNWYGYGANVLAVADATVVEAKDDIEGQADIESAAGPVLLENASGNYITLDLGAGRYAFYEHLKHGSVRVKVGDRVRRGDVMGMLGNTGSSSAGPHLHFHVADANASLGAEGLPYVFESYEAVAAYQDIADVGSGVAPSPLPQGVGGKRHGEMPPPNTVVSF